MCCHQQSSWGMSWGTVGVSQGEACVCEPQEIQHLPLSTTLVSSVSVSVYCSPPVNLHSSDPPSAVKCE